jgi:hypothetical protein
MGAPGFGPSYPSTAYILSLIGGIFIVIDAIITIAVTAALGSVLAGLGFPGFGAILVTLGVIALIFGLIVLYGAIQLKSNPARAKHWGVLILVFSIVAFLGGGGFYIGSILGLIGGIMALTWSPPTPAPGYGQPMAAGTPAWGAPPPPAAPPPPMGQKFCAHCGSPNAAGAQFCAKCGAPMSG